MASARSAKVFEHRDNVLDHDEHENSKADEDDKHFPGLGTRGLVPSVAAEMIS